MGYTPDWRKHDMVPLEPPTLVGGTSFGGKHMALFQRVVAALQRDDKGQGLAEYALILALIAIVAIIALIFLGTQVSGILSTVGGSV
jgi:Flp pilus assembly pilin Flp